MSLETAFHEQWLGLVQPVDGLVVSVPVLVDAQCMSRQPPAVQARLAELAPEGRIEDLPAFLEEILGLTPDLLDAAPPDELSLYVPEGRQTLRPTLALRRQDAAPPPASASAPDATPASIAGLPYVALLWDLPAGLPLDRPETATGTWDYPPAAKLDRLLRHCRVPIGILCNRAELRLVYAPHGESSGSITFRVADMCTVGGRPILDALVMLLGATRFFAVAPEHQLPAILAESRRRQANVTNELADQVFEALEILLAGFEAAAERDGRFVLDDALAREPDGDHVYGGLLTVLLRLVFLLYAEDRGLLPTGKPAYDEGLSILGLFAQLQGDRGAFPDSMSRRHGAWGRLLSLFRAVFLGVEHGDLHLPPRRGQLFDPGLYPFLEGWGPEGGAPVDAAARAAVRVPSVDDATIHGVLEKLLVFQGQRLSYRALDVEQIGSVYEALMGYHVVRLAGPSVCLRPNRVWISPAAVLAEPAGRRARWLQEETGLSKAQAARLAEAVGEAATDEDALAALEALAARGTRRALPGRLVIQPGAERRRTSSHYTPRSLTEPIVRRTLDPLLAVLGPEPSSEHLLRLKICDPAMGSGAFLVEACRFLADHVVAAWTREGRRAAAGEDVVMQARRLVAQRCLYGVDRNPFAVNLAKLSIWLVTLARDLPFTFVDHALRHGDSLVGLSFEQITAFHWRPEEQLELCQKELVAVLDEAVASRQRILDLAGDPSPAAQREKEWLLRDSEDALDRIRLIGDLIVGAFFAGESDKERKKERVRRLALVLDWLREGGPPPDELRELQAELRRRIPVFHWMTEYPEVFWAKRPDPLDGDRVGGQAWIDAFVGNPPFAGKNNIAESGGESYVEWLKGLHEGAHGNADLSAHFFRRADSLLGGHGTIGLIATNTIAQGDTRSTALQPMLARGHVIYDATRSMLWPGDAAVAVSVVHLAKGSPAATRSTPRLDGAIVPAISSRLRGAPERLDPRPLAANASLSFQGSIVLGMGFVLTPEERDALVKKDGRNAERIFPYLGGEEVNTSPTQAFERYVISFGQMTLEEARRWPDLLEIVREKVKPEREKNNREGYRKYWWQFGEKRVELFEATRGLPRCLVTAIVSKHLMFSFQPSDRIFSHRLFVFPIPNATSLAVLQSSVHDCWVRLLSSTLEERLNYSASDCFETFPFPQPDPRAVIPALEDIGQRLYDARAQYMVDTQQGLTQTYNRLKDPDDHEPRIEELRRLHLEMDRAVLDAYGWSDIPVPPYTTPVTDAEKKALEAFEDAVIDRLFVLNAQRAEEERIRGAAAVPEKKPATPKKAKKKPPSGQGNLGLG